MVFIYFRIPTAKGRAGKEDSGGGILQHGDLHPGMQEYQRHSRKGLLPWVLEAGQQPGKGQPGKADGMGLSLMTGEEPPQRAAEINHTFGCKSLLDVQQLLGKLDGLILAMP